MSGEGYNKQECESSEVKRFCKPTAFIEASGKVEPLRHVVHVHDYKLIFEVVGGGVGQGSVRLFVPHEHLLWAVIDTHSHDDAGAGSL